jgi:CRP-like cAMP-binding protein
MATSNGEPLDAPQYCGRHTAGEMIFKENDPGTDMYIIQEGQVEILKRFKGEERQVAVLEQGDFFGEMAILEDLPRSASARAATDCVLLRIDHSTFDQMVRHNPEIPVRMLRKLSRRLRAANPLLIDVDPSSEAAVHMNVAASSAPSPAARVVAGSGQPRFVHQDTGTELYLAPDAETTVGRYDAATGIHPDIDLKPIDVERSISRRHAKVIRRDGRYFILEEIGTANGTFVNRKRLQKGSEVEFVEGDEVQFGLVKTVFRAG